MNWKIKLTYSLKKFRRFSERPQKKFAETVKRINDEDNQK